jgi:hypothetical protein
MRSRMVGWVGSVVACAAAVAAATAAPPGPGIYVEQPAASGEPGLDKVESSRPSRTGTKDIGKTIVKGMLTGGMLGGGPKLALIFPGARSAARLSSQPMFQFHFDPQAAAAPSAPAAPTDMAAMMAMMEGAQGGGGEIPPGVSRPQDFALVRLEAKGDERELEASTDMKPNRKRTIACRVRQLGPTVFRVAPESALPPGEYAFVAVPRQGGGMDRMWDFGVDR